MSEYDPIFAEVSAIMGTHTCKEINEEDATDQSTVTREAREIAEALNRLKQRVTGLSKMIASRGERGPGLHQNAQVYGKLCEATKLAEQVWEIRSEVSE